MQLFPTDFKKHVFKKKLVYFRQNLVEPFWQPSSAKITIAKAPEI